MIHVFYGKHGVILTGKLDEGKTFGPSSRFVHDEFYCQRAQVNTEREREIYIKT